MDSSRADIGEEFFVLYSGSMTCQPRYGSSSSFLLFFLRFRKATFYSRLAESPVRYRRRHLALTIKAKNLKRIDAKVEGRERLTLFGHPWDSCANVSFQLGTVTKLLDTLFFMF